MSGSSDLPGHLPGRGWRAAVPDGGVLLAVGMGGALGGLVRVGAGLLGTQADLPGWAVLAAVNVLGSLVMGLVSARGGWARPAVTTGLLGGFTSFSGWVLDVLRLVEAAPGLAVALLVAVPAAAVSACLAGLVLGGRRA